MPVALRALDRGGDPGGRRHLALRHPGLDYADELFQERRLRSVTANTRADGEEFLAAGRAARRPRRRPSAYPMADAPAALADLAHGRFGGAAVLHN